MAAVFSITTATNEIVLKDLRGTASFTVQNISGGPLTGGGRIIPDAPAQPSWFTIEGQAQRPFDRGEVEEYAVDVVVPQGTPAGTYSFHLEMVNVANPDDFFSEGPGVTFKVQETPPPPPPCPPGGYLETFVGAVAGELVLGLLVGFFKSASLELLALLVGAVGGAAAALYLRGRAGPFLTAAILLVAQIVWSVPLFLLFRAPAFSRAVPFAGLRLFPLVLLLMLPIPLVARGVALVGLGSFTWPWCRFMRRTA
jgi:hypothetical protein